MTRSFFMMIPLLTAGCLPELPEFGADESDTGDDSADTGEAVDCQHKVPLDFTTIQEAMEQAEVGDTICVAEGTYYESLDWLGKDVWVYGVGGAESTILDGGQDGRVVQFENGETEAAGLQNFTIQNGQAYKGAGIYIDQSSPTFVDVIIKNNTCEPTETLMCEGVGVYVHEGSAAFHGLRVADNSVTASVDSESVGVGIYADDASITLDGAWITDNTFEVDEAFDGEGPAMNGVGIWAGGSRLELSQVVLAKNWATGLGDTDETTQFKGSALYITNNSQLQASHVLVADNGVQHAGDAPCFGPIVAVNSTAQVEYLRVVGNSTLCSNGMAALAHLSLASAARFEHAVFHGNMMYELKEEEGSDPPEGGILLMESSLKLYNSSFSENEGHASAVNGIGAKISLESSCSTFDGEANDLFSGVDDPRGQSGNIGQAPSFQDVSSEHGMGWNVHLSSDSPLVGAGCQTDLDEKVNMNPNDSSPDIGAYGGYEADLWDLDADGDLEWWHSRPYIEADMHESKDCNDLDQAVNSSRGCP